MPVLKLRFYRKIRKIKKLHQFCVKQIEVIQYIQETDRQQLLSKTKKEEVLRQQQIKYLKFLDKVYEQGYISEEERKHMELKEEWQSFEDIEYYYQKLAIVLKNCLPWNDEQRNIQKLQRQLDVMIKGICIMMLIALPMLVLFLCMIIASEIA